MLTRLRPPSEFAVSADWAAPANVHAFTTLRGGPGVSLPPFDRFNLGLRCGDESAHAAENRARLLSEFALPSAPHWLQQVHGAGVVRLDRPGTDAASARAGADAVEPVAARAGADAPEPVADAAVTATPGVVIAILTADCLPVLFCNRQGSEVAGAHAGWRGLAGGVLEATLSAMQSPAGEVIAWLGPAAGPKNYEIGVEVHDAFVRGDADAASAFTATRPGHWRVDLYALARRRLRAAGVQTITGGELCTIADAGRFYSHRRDQRTGRMASLIWLQ